MAGMTEFPAAQMMGLVDGAVRFDLAESTTPALRLGELTTADELAGLRLEYGTSAGDAKLRALVAGRTGAGADQVLMTVGASQALFLLAQDRCGPGDHVVVASPCFPPTRVVPEGLGARVSLLRLRFDDRVFRLGFGHLPPEFTGALDRLAVALKAAVDGR